MPVGADRPESALHDAARTVLSDLPQGSAVGVALSGGSDSMAVLHLMAEVCGRAGIVLLAATVDHGLRDTAAAEVAFAAAASASLGVAHESLLWHHGTVPGNLMAAARTARYGLLADWARRHGVGGVLLGHTADDQAETFLMGLSRSAGLDGLVGMRARFSWDGVAFYRPFLDATRAGLRAWLGARGAGWVDDPTNEDLRFSRVRARAALRVLQPLGINVRVIAASMAHLRAAQGEVRARLAEASGRVATVAAGAVTFGRAAWLAESGEMRRLLMQEALRWISGAGHPPRSAALARIVDAAEAGRDATLGGVRLRCDPDRLRLVREYRAVADLRCGMGEVWDGRWRLERGQEDGEAAVGSWDTLNIGGLGAKGLRACPHWRATGIGREALLVSPAVWRGGQLVAAPVAGFAEGWRARIVAPWPPVSVSH